MVLREREDVELEPALARKPSHDGALVRKVEPLSKTCQRAVRKQKWRRKQDAYGLHIHSDLGREMYNGGVDLLRFADGAERARIGEEEEMVDRGYPRFR